MLWGLNPEKYWIYIERRTNGCFSCEGSKREKRNGRMESFCDMEELMDNNYPDETEESCGYYRRRNG